MGVNTFSDLGAPAGSNIFEMIVPGDKVGLIIGKGGETIKQLQEATGAKMVIVQVKIQKFRYTTSCSKKVFFSRILLLLQMKNHSKYQELQKASNMLKKWSSKSSTRTR